MLRAQSFLLIVIAIIFSSVASFAGNPAAPATPPTSSFGQIIVKALIGALGPAYFQIREDITFTFDPQGSSSVTVNDLDGKAGVLLENDIVVPLSSSTGDPTLDKIIPKLQIATKGLRAQFVTSMNNQSQLTGKLQFVAADGSPASPIATIASHSVQVFSLQFSSVDFVADNLLNQSGTANISGSCHVTTGIVSSETDQVVQATPLCQFTLSYDKSSGKVVFREKFDSLTETPTQLDPSAGRL